MIKNVLEKLDRNKKYHLACGHNNAAVLNLWPFDTVVCLDCGFKTQRVEEVKD